MTDSLRVVSAVNNPLKQINDMKEQDYNSMTTPDLEESMRELEFELANEIDDEEYLEELEAEHEAAQRILDERALAEEEIEAEMEASEE